MTTATDPRARSMARTRPHPVACGWCRFCRREMWTDCPNDSPLLRAAADGITCDSCRNWIKRNPGGDPIRARGSVAERTLAELPEDDASWRERARCRELDSDAFDPDPDPDDDQRTEHDRDAAWRDRHYAADRICGACPVLERCRATALAQGYEGLWGGLFITRLRWRNLATDETGWTIHAGKTDKREHARAVAAGRMTKGAA